MSALLKSQLSFVTRIRVIHPLLLAIFPILFLWSQNIEELSFKLTTSDIIMPLAISFGATLVMLVLARFLFKSWAKAGLIVSMFLLLFFSYGHVVRLVNVETVDFLRHRHILLVWAALFGLGVLLSIRAHGDMKAITRYLNIVGLALLLTTVVSIGTFQISSVSALQDPESSSQASPAATIDDAGDRPDIYFIMLDAYASSRSLKNNMGFDNHEFIEYLESQDFYIPSGGRSNYTNTTLSMASAMNMKLLDELTDLHPGDSNDPSALIEMTRSSEVMGFLRSRGYKILHFKNVWMPNEKLGYEDLYVGCERSGLFSLGGDEFSVSLIRTTLADPFLARFGIVQDELRARRLCDFSKFIETIDVPGPKFVFAAFTVPHPPFLFGRNGEPVSSIETSYTVWGSREQYLDQLHYVNLRVKEILDRLLSTPSDSPAVIIQGDHGTWFLDDSVGEDVYRERLQIINAYLLPGGGRELLYDEITPVNSFRVVFNHYFGANYELLADNSYYTNMDKGWYNYLDVTDAVRGAQQ